MNLYRNKIPLLNLALMACSFGFYLFLKPETLFEEQKNEDTIIGYSFSNFF